jgi:hypothetical protein
MAPRPASLRNLSGEVIVAFRFCTLEGAHLSVLFECPRMTGGIGAARRMQTGDGIGTIGTMGVPLKESSSVVT